MKYRPYSDGKNPVSEPKHGNRDHGEGLLLQHQKHEYGREREESRHLAQALQDADFDARKRRPFDGEVVQERLPGGKPQRYRDARDDQKDDRGAVLLGDHSSAIVEQLGVDPQQTPFTIGFNLAHGLAV